MARYLGSSPHKEAGPEPFGPRLKGAQYNFFIRFALGELGPFLWEKSHS